MKLGKIQELLEASKFCKRVELRHEPLLRIRALAAHGPTSSLMLEATKAMESPHVNPSEVYGMMIGHFVEGKGIISSSERKRGEGWRQRRVINTSTQRPKATYHLFYEK